MTSSYREKTIQIRNIAYNAYIINNVHSTHAVDERLDMIYYRAGERLYTHRRQQFAFVPHPSHHIYSRVFV